MTDYRFEVFRMLLSFACGLLSIKHLVDVCKYMKKEDTLQMVYHGIWAMCMLMIFKL
jgi:hypothetical protein